MWCVKFVLQQSIVWQTQTKSPEVTEDVLLDANLIVVGTIYPIHPYLDYD